MAAFAAAAAAAFGRFLAADAGGAGRRPAEGADGQVTIRVIAEVAIFSRPGRRR